MIITMFDSAYITLRVSCSQKTKWHRIFLRQSLAISVMLNIILRQSLEIFVMLKIILRQSLDILVMLNIILNPITLYSLRTTGP